jgi:DNA-binding phage protein
MNRTRKKRTKPVLQAYDPRLMEQIETQLALAREMTQLATELRVCVAQIERTLRNGRAVNVVPLPERVN